MLGDGGRRSRRLRAVLADLEANAGATSIDTRARLAAKAFAHTAQYDTMVSRLSAEPRRHGADDVPGHAAAGLRQAPGPALRRESASAGRVLPRAGRRGSASPPRTMLQGKELSFNNIADADTALECVRVFDEPACVIVKHANPCGVATAVSLADAYDGAYRTDPTSAFGGIIAFNRALDAETATAIIEPAVRRSDRGAVGVRRGREVLAGKQNVRVLVIGPLSAKCPVRARIPQRRRRPARADPRHRARRSPTRSRSSREKQPTPTQDADLWFAWRVCKYVKSNAIVFARDGLTVGIGAGQMSRVYSTRIAAMKAKDEGLPVAGCAMASDAFFPFRDGLDVAAEHGITAIIQPGGCNATTKSSRPPTSTASRWCSPACATSGTERVSHENPDHRRRRPRARARVEVRAVAARVRSAGRARQCRHRHRAEVRNVAVRPRTSRDSSRSRSAKRVDLTIVGPEGPLVRRRRRVRGRRPALLRAEPGRRAARRLQGLHQGIPGAPRHSDRGVRHVHARHLRSRLAARSSARRSS